MFEDYDLARIAYINELYIEGWQQQEYYSRLMDGDAAFGITLHMCANIPVAAAIVNRDTCLLSVYVKPEYRNQGIGKKLISALLNKYSLSIDEVYGSYGTEGSEIFYKSLGIAYFNDTYTPMSNTECDALIKGEITEKYIRLLRIKECLATYSNLNNNNLSM